MFMTSDPDSTVKTDSSERVSLSFYRPVGWLVLSCFGMNVEITKKDKTLVPSF